MKGVPQILTSLDERVNLEEKKEENWCAIIETPPSV